MEKDTLQISIIKLNGGVVGLRGLKRKIPLKSAVPNFAVFSPPSRHPCSRGMSLEQIPFDDREGSFCSLIPTQPLPPVLSISPTGHQGAS